MTPIEKQLQKALAVLAGYELWEASMLADNAAWQNGAAPYPTLNAALYTELISLQGPRNEVLHPTPMPPAIEKETWWIGLKPQEMPAYLKVIDDCFHPYDVPYFVKAHKYMREGVIVDGFKLKDGTDGMYGPLSDFLPATEAEYMASKQTTA